MMQYSAGSDGLGRQWRPHQEYTLAAGRVPLIVAWLFALLMYAVVCLVVWPLLLVLKCRQKRLCTTLITVPVSVAPESQFER